MSRLLRSIHVGVGRRGRWPVEVAAADPHWEIAALVDLNAEFLAEAQALAGLPGARCFSTLEDALAGVEADAVIICTPTLYHAPLARLAFAAGKHVLVEKGMTTDLATGVELVAGADAAGVRFCVAQNYRFRPVELALETHLKEGRLGLPRVVDLIHHRYRPTPATLNYPGAVLWDMGCHHFDTLIHLFGPVQEVMARTYNPPWSQYAHDSGVSAVMTFENGVVAAYCLTHCAQNHYYHFLMQTDKGTVQLWEQPAKGIEFRAIGSRGDTVEKLPIPVQPRSEQRVLDAFRRYIAEGIEPGLSGRNNLQVLAVSEAMLRSAKTGRAVGVQELLP